jgi:predicted DNA binding protein
MSLVTVRIPACDLAFEHTFDAAPDVRFEMIQAVAAERTVSMAYVRMWGESREEIETALDADPSVDEFEAVSQRAESWLYEISWDTPRLFVLRELVFQRDGQIVAVSGQGGTWTLRLLVLDRDDISKVVDDATAHDFSVDVVRITKMDSQTASPGELTEEQYETLLMAVEKGYFEIPRRTTMEELATEFGISHQALSERLRRGHRMLIESALEGQTLSLD